MEKKKKEIKKIDHSKKEKVKNSNKNKENIKEFTSQKQSATFYVIISIFVLLIVIGVIASKNLNSAYGVTTYEITFRTAEGKNLSDTNYSGYSPLNGICRTDEYGYLDVDCAYQIACVDRFWSTVKTDRIKCGSAPNDCTDEDTANGEHYYWPTQSRDLNQNDLFTTRFTENKTYYGVVNQSYYSYNCDYSKPTESCYVCEGGSNPVKTINETRAATMTGVSDSSKCQAVADSQCEPKPSTETPKPSTETPKPSTETPKPSTEAPKNKCYSCKLGEGKEYAYSTSKEEAASKTGGTECVPVSDTNCDNPPKNCYVCDTKDGKKYTNTTSVENAKIAIDGGINCTIVNSSLCEIVPDNPKTGTAGIIIVWLVGLSALIYSFIYFVKLRKITG